MINLSRTQVDALGDLRYSGRMRAHYATKRSLRRMGLIRWERSPVNGRVVYSLSEIGRQVIDTLGQLIEGTAPLGTDAQGNQITVMPLDLTTNIDLGGSY